MRKICLIICIFISLLFCGCGQQQQNYVKNISIEKIDDLYKFTVVSYDFSSEQESFTQEQFVSEDLFLLGSKAVVDGDYNLRLCEACYISPKLFNEINQVVNMLNSIRFPVSSSVLCRKDYDNEIQLPDSNPCDYYPVYNLKMDKGKVTGVFSIVDNNNYSDGLLFVHNGIPVKILDKKQSDVFNMLTNTADSIDYPFWDNHISARLDIIDCYFSTNKGDVILNINLFLGNFTGLDNYVQDTEFYIELLKKQLENDIYSVISDPVINSVYNMMWYADHQEKDNTKIEIRLNIL